MHTYPTKCDADIVLVLKDCVDPIVSCGAWTTQQSFAAQSVERHVQSSRVQVLPDVGRVFVVQVAMIEHVVVIISIAVFLVVVCGPHEEMRNTVVLSHHHFQSSKAVDKGISLLWKWWLEQELQALELGRGIEGRGGHGVGQRGNVPSVVSILWILVPAP